VDILITPQEIRAKVQTLGQEITREYSGKDLLLLGIFKIAFIFLADLVRAIDIPVQIDFMDISSYGPSTVSSGEVRIIKDLDASIKGKNVLLVEDIVDTGLTLKYITAILHKREPESIKICCMLDKPSRRIADIKPDFCGYAVEDRFIVGYGLDYRENYREYPAICELKPCVYQGRNDKEQPPDKS